MALLVGSQRNGAHRFVALYRREFGTAWSGGWKARSTFRPQGLVKRLLRRYGYPPDLQDAAVQKVLQQAEALSAEWAA